MKTKLRLLLAAGLMNAALNGFGQLVITTQPSNQTVYVGETATFNVEAVVDGPVFQWRFNGADFGDPEVTGRLVLENVQFTNAGGYSVVIADFNGAVTSQVARLSVLPTDVVHLGDLELRFGEASNVAELNTMGDEQASSLSADGLTLFIDSTRSGRVGGFDIWICTRPTASSPWGPAVNLGAPINSAFNDGDPKISADGLALHFDSDRAEGARGGIDIWVANRSTPDEPFGTPVNLGSPVNGPDHDAAPAISADNRTLVFSSNRPGGEGRFDLWITTRTSPAAPWEPALNLAPVNSANDEAFPCLSADGLLLFFMSGRFSTGERAIWVSKRATPASAVGSPVRIRAIAEPPIHADSPNLSADGTTLYFSSANRSGGQGGYDLWQISMTSLPRLMARGVNGNGEFQFELLGREGAIYEIESSTDCRSWTPWLTTNTTSRVMLSDPAQAADVRRFYRAVSR